MHVSKQQLSEGALPALPGRPLRYPRASILGQASVGREERPPNSYPHGPRWFLFHLPCSSSLPLSSTLESPHCSHALVRPRPVSFCSPTALPRCRKHPVSVSLGPHRGCRLLVGTPLVQATRQPSTTRARARMRPQLPQRRIDNPE